MKKIDRIELIAILIIDGKSVSSIEFQEITMVILS